MLTASRGRFTVSGHTLRKGNTDAEGDKADRSKIILWEGTAAMFWFIFLSAICLPRSVLAVTYVEPVLEPSSLSDCPQAILTGCPRVL